MLKKIKVVQLLLSVDFSTAERVTEDLVEKKEISAITMKFYINLHTN